MLDGRFAILSSVATLFWLLGFWSNRNANRHQINIGTTIAAFFGGRNGNVSIFSLSSQIGFASVVVFDTILRSIFANWNFRISFIMGGITLLLLRYSLIRLWKKRAAPTNPKMGNR